MKYKQDQIQPGVRFAKQGQDASDWEIVSVHEAVDGIPLIKLKSLQDHSQLKTLSVHALMDRKLYRYLQPQNL